MPQLETTYYISQLFWLFILFGVFITYISKSFIPRVQEKLYLRLSTIDNCIKKSEEFLNQSKNLTLQINEKKSLLKNELRDIRLKCNEQIEDITIATKKELNQSLLNEEKKFSSSIRKLKEKFEIELPKKSSEMNDLVLKLLIKKFDLKRNKLKLGS